MESKWLTGVTPAVTSILGNGSTIFIWNLGSLWPRVCNNTIALVMRGPCLFCHESATLKWKCRHFLPRMSFFVLQRFIDHSGLISDRETHAAFPCYSMPKTICGPISRKGGEISPYVTTHTSTVHFKTRFKWMPLSTPCGQQFINDLY